MEKNNKPSVYKKIRYGFYSTVAEEEKRDKSKLIIVAIATFFLACVLLFTASILETRAGKYTYVYGNYSQRISKEQAFSNKHQLIDMNALADYCGFEKNSSPAKAEYKINGTSAIFYNGKSTATVNGIDFSMPTQAIIKNGYCLIPISSASELLLGVEIDVNKKNTEITINEKAVFMIVEQPKAEYVTDMSGYLEYINSNDPYIFILVNKQNPIDEDFPTDKDSLIEIPSKYRKEETIYFYTVALQALEGMMNDMFALGYTDTYVTSAYRNHAYQTMLFEMYINNEMKKGYSYDEALALANKYSARPEHSEHRTGLCVDFTTRSIGGVVDDIFETTEVSDWLKENAWKYGFILRYPKDKVDITGYQYESWHYRFVGLERASIIHQTGLCYEEYLEYFEQAQ